MNIWLVTTGSSDVQLTSSEHWNDWWQDIKKSLYRLRFEPVRSIDDDGEPYRLPARVLGLAYEQLAGEMKPKLSLPLLQDFTKELKAKNVLIDQIIVLMSDQENLFAEADRETKRCPYWQDTYQLYPILENYFHQHFPDAEVKPLLLKPESSDKGLDDWDAVLGFVQQEIAGLKFENEPETVYVSHQAGTPAISSAVQFISLARFGDRVRFLVSSEDTRSPEILPSSSYLKGIRLQEAKTLLDRHDYSGVKTLANSYLDRETQILLDAAIQWNFAKFDEFANELQKLSDQDLVQNVKERRQQWWWTAYESAYLAIVRLDKQKDTVDALFHSFRAIEGIFTEWGVQHFQNHIQMKNDRPYLQTTILDEEHYFSRVKYKEKDGEQVPDNDIAKLKSVLEDLRRRGKDTVFYGFTLYTLFREVRQEWKSKCKTISRFWDTNNGISEKRNKIFHQLRGLTEIELFEIWEVDNLEAWKERMREFANFVSGETFEFLDQIGSDGKVASLMTKVHQELEQSIASL